MDERKICQNCKNMKNKKCKINDKYVARKKSCDIDKFEKKK